MAKRFLSAPGAPLSEEELRYRVWRQKDLKGKLKDLFPSLKDLWPKKSQTQPPGRFTGVPSVCYFWLMVFTVSYVVIYYCLPANYAEYGDRSVLYLQVFALWVTIQCAANWLCVRWDHSKMRKGSSSIPVPEWRKDQRPADMLKNDYTGRAPASSQTHVVAMEYDGRGTLPWKRCQKCDHDAPFRAHHCPICDVCILKRDHHCYFSGTCIGFHNQRYFIVMCFYLALSNLWAFYEIGYYMRRDFLPDVTSGWDYFIGWTLYKCVTGHAQCRHVLMTWHLYMLWLLGLIGLAFFLWQMLIIPHGWTTHELMMRRGVRRTCEARALCREVMGPWWLLNFCLPAAIFSRLQGDGKHWNNLKIVEPGAEQAADK